VSSREDIVQKFNLLLDNAARKPGSINRGTDDEVVADRISLEALFRAGYDPRALADALDRLTENKGSTGNSFSDLFG
jgi:predicted Zn-dependent protease